MNVVVVIVVVAVVDENSFLESSRAVLARNSTMKKMASWLGLFPRVQQHVRTIHQIGF